MTNFVFLMEGETNMKVCPNCNNANIADEAVFCPACGANFAPAPQQVPQQNPQQPQNFNQQGYQVSPPQPRIDIYDHTAQFDAKDIADNKLYAMLIYLFGVIGIVLALLKKDDSEYLKFHVKQGLKFLVCYGIVILVMAVLSWTFIVPIVASLALVALCVVEIICFFDVCKNKAKDAYIIRSFKFLD